MGGRRYEIFRILGFPVRVDLSWLIILSLVTYSLAAGYFPANHPGLPVTAYWAMGFVAAVGLFLSILFHELSHALVARHYRIKIDGITLFVFGGVAEMKNESPSPKAEFFVAVMGPVASILLAGAFIYLSSLLRGYEVNRGLVLILYYLGFMNGLLAAFNLVPAFPLDGGRVFRSILWAIKKDYEWATRISAVIGQGFGWLLVGFGGFNLLRGNPLSGLWYILIGFFLKRASQMSMQEVVLRKRMKGVLVSEVMETDFIKLHPEDRLIDVFARLEKQTLRSHYPVVESGHLVGALPIMRLNNLEVEGWQYGTVSDLLDYNLAEVTIDKAQSAWDAFQRMRQDSSNILFVVDEGRVAGLVTLEGLLSFAKV
jgi:Zn-dependent protease/CBS domain-containing protein